VYQPNDKLGGLGFSWGELNPLHVAQRITPPEIKNLVHKVTSQIEAVTLPHGLQSKDARNTRLGKLQTNKNFGIVIQGVLTVFTMGVYAAVIAAALQYAKEERARRIRDKMLNWDKATNGQLDTYDAQWLRLENERKRLAAGGPIDPAFQINEQLTEGTADMYTHPATQQATPLNGWLDTIGQAVGIVAQERASSRAADVAKGDAAARIAESAANVKAAELALQAETLRAQTAKQSSPMVMPLLIATGAVGVAGLVYYIMRKRRR
jgi:hypothetical protein